MAEPRHLPARVKRAIFFKHPFAMFGMLFLVPGLAMLLVFGRATDFSSVFLFGSDDPQVAGQLLDKRPSNATVNKRQIYQYDYRYRIDGIRYAGRAFAPDDGSIPGSAVLVEYVADHPARSRIHGMRLAPFGMRTVLMIAIFPAIGLAMLLFARHRYLRYLHLVRNGVLTTGKVVRKTATSTQINKKTVYEVYFRYKSADGVEHESRVDTHETDRLGDEAREPLVYDPARPGQAVLLDAMPPAVRTLLLCT